MPTTLRVVGDSITYLAGRHGATAMFAEHGYEATIDGARGQRADSPLRQQAWIDACRLRPTVAVYALGTNDLMGETLKDPDEPVFSTDELATLTSVLAARLHYAAFYCEDVVWVNCNSGTMNGHYNRAARLVNDVMRSLCADAGFGYADWDATGAPTTDLIHQTPAGSALWVDAICAAI